ncbi:hypothetical protein [Nocardioides sp.]|uniref:hypothetical protein n=1 Tax=Nocardioides sp. TaxID=35761 RepID=UPI00262FAD6D|nr:hypothetical protein [Nocardioides sp.]
MTERRDGPLPPERAASRLAAYVYGNILVLASVAVATGHTIENGEAALLVVGTGVTTYVAHVFAELVAHSAVPDSHPAEHAGPERVRESVLDELRDAVPIASSAFFPSFVLMLGWFGWLPTALAALIAGGSVVLRMAAVQLVAERVRGRQLSFRVFVGGLITAGVAAVIVVAKVALGH